MRVPFARSLILCAAVLLAAAPPLEAQDTTPAQIEITPPESVTVGGVEVVAVGDTAAPDTASIVWPEHFTVKNFVIDNQLWLVTVLTSMILFILAKVPAFAELRDGITRGVQIAIGAAISWLVLQWGGTPDAALAALITGALSALAGGMTFRMGRTQPGNTKS